MSSPSYIQNKPISPEYYSPPPAYPPSNYPPQPSLGAQTISSTDLSAASYAFKAPFNSLEDSPVKFLCPFCNNICISRPKRVSGICSWISGVISCGIIACCCSSSFKDVAHICPNCHNSIGKYRRIGI